MIAEEKSRRGVRQYVGQASRIVGPAIASHEIRVVMNVGGVDESVQTTGLIEVVPYEQQNQQWNQKKRGRAEGETGECVHRQTAMVWSAIPHFARMDRRHAPASAVFDEYRQTADDTSFLRVMTNRGGGELATIQDK